MESRQSSVEGVHECGQHESLQALGHHRPLAEEIG